tara:strand:+ start:1494 stop:1604 length:111 start_codon:yes stop_codon:yes gene_type:complete
MGVSVIPRSFFKPLLGDSERAILGTFLKFSQNPGGD